MEAINIFLKKEQESKLFQRKLFGICYWEYIRPVVSCETNSTISQTSEMFSKTKFSFSKYALRLKNFKDYFLKKKDYDILVVAQPRRVKTKKGYRSNIVDYYIDYLKEDYKVKAIEEPTYCSLGVSNNAHEFPLYTEDIYLTDIHELMHIIRKRIYKIIHPIKYKKILKEYEEVHTILNSWYKKGHPIVNFKEFFIDSIIRLDKDWYYVKRIIRKINPKAVMLYYMPGIFKQMIIHECNLQNIPTIEIQHGTITKIDPLVNHTYDMATIHNDNQYIFSFGDLQVNHYALTIKDEKKVIPVGFPFFEEKIKELSKSRTKRKKEILIVSQSTIGDAISKWTAELADLIKDTDYHITFKYHPSEIPKNYECLKKDNITEIKTEKTIYDLQKEAEIQIGSYSTSLYEGFALKVPTLVIESMFGSIETVDILKDIKKGAYFIDKPEDVLKYLGRHDITPLDKDIEKIWKMNSKENIKKEIKKIIGG